MSGRQAGILGGGLALVGALLIGAGVVIGAQPGSGLAGMMGGSVVGRAWGTDPFGHVGMMGGGMMGGTWGPGPAGGGMMGGAGWGSTAPGPGKPGFVAGTAASPRVVRVIAGPGYRFAPSTIAVARGETITFEVTTMGPTAHEFMVGPADAVAADREGTPEVADIGMMQTRSLTYTFDGSGPYAFACHAPGHYEAGMAGTITVIG